MNSRWFHSLCAVAALCTAACPPPGEHVHLYGTKPKAPSLDAAEIEALGHLGPTMVDQGINFSVYSERASRIEVMLFDDPESDRPTRQFPMERFGDVWNLYVEGIGLGQHYGYIAWGPNWEYDEKWYPGAIDGFQADVDAEGNRFNPNKLLTDPYCKAHHRDFDWSKASLASGPKRTDVTYAASAKCVVVQSDYAWSANETSWRDKRTDSHWRGHSWKDLIIYEVHPTGFTKSPASGVTHPGTFLGLAEKADYLKDLGITAVELLPVMEKPLDGGYWGYQTLNFFAPELTYATKNEQASVIDEFKQMVEAFHQRGIEVFLDVVYNHTGEGGLWRNKLEQDISPNASFDSELVNYDAKEVAGLYSYRGLDNHAYYALSGDNQTYWDNTGVGQETRPNNRPLRRLAIDSLHYWAEEMHVDGFRFDLAPILGEKDKDYNSYDDTKNTVLQEIIDDPVLKAHNVRIIAEPWSVRGLYKFPKETERPEVGWYEWNGAFRDWWRAFDNNLTFKRWPDAPGPQSWTFNNVEVDRNGGEALTGSAAWFKSNGRRPYHAVNFVTIHDGFTLYDLFSYEAPRNKCGPLNPVCCDQPTSPFCDRESGTKGADNRSWDWSKSCPNGFDWKGAPIDRGSPAFLAANPNFRAAYCECELPETNVYTCSKLNAEPIKRQLMRNLFAAMMISHGTPMLLGGDEWMRTQLGNNNAYPTRADNEFNWFDWGSWQPANEKQRMHDFVRKVIQLRKDHAYAFAPDDYGTGAPFAWKTPANQDANDATWNGKSMMIHYYDPSKGPELLVLINMEQDPISSPPGARGSGCSTPRSTSNRRSTWPSRASRRRPRPTSPSRPPC